MKRFMLSPKYYGLFEYQNRKNKKEPCFIDYGCDGVLLDNFMLYGRRCLFLIKEHYINPNMSDYVVYCAKYNTNDENVLYNELEKLIKIQDEWEKGE